MLRSVRLVSVLLILARISISQVDDFQICLSTFVSSMMTGLECGHRFCHGCWAEYLTTKVMSEGIGQTISCAAHNCETLIDDATVVKLVPDAKVRQKYQHLITNSFVEVCSSSALQTL